MSKFSKIEWTESTWNPVTGCTKISEGCKNCYAERMAVRLKAMGNKNYENGFNLTIHKHMFELPLTWKKPQTIFVNSMSDLFHEDIPIEIIQQLFHVMKEAYWHKFQILTKRPERLMILSEEIDWPVNVWMGVTVEHENYSNRIEYLRSCKSNYKFVSFEPLLGPVHKINLEGIDWVIVGGESGPNARLIERNWVVEIKNQCVDNTIPFFFKQWGGINKKKNGRLLEGRTWNQMPTRKILLPCKY